MLSVALLLVSAGPGQPPAEKPMPVKSPAALLKPPRQLPIASTDPVPNDFQLPNSFPLHAPAPVSPPPTLADCLRGCPAPTNDAAPFLRLPKVSPVPECRTSEGTGTADTGTVWRHTWHTAARFTLPRFDQAAERIDGDALVIYEGMVLTVNQKTGVFDLDFTVTTPPTAVTLRLQLAFVADPKSPAVRLTLPPIRLDSDDDGKPGDNSGQTLHIHHRGKSELFVKADAPFGGPTPFLGRTSDLDPAPVIDPAMGWKPIRIGTARFGSARINVDSSDR